MAGNLFICFLCAHAVTCQALHAPNLHVQLSACLSKVVSRKYIELPFTSLG